MVNRRLSLQAAHSQFGKEEKERSKGFISFFVPLLGESNAFPNPLSKVLLTPYWPELFHKGTSSCKRDWELREPFSFRSLLQRKAKGKGAGN